MHAHQRHVKLDFRLKDAAGLGDLQFIQWVQAHGYHVVVRRIIKGLIVRMNMHPRRDHLEVVTCLALHCGASNISINVRFVLEGKQIHVLEWLLQNEPGLEAMNVEQQVRSLALIERPISITSCVDNIENSAISVGAQG